MSKYWLLKIFAGFLLIIVLSSDAIADETLGHQQVFKKVDNFYAKAQKSNTVLAINGEILLLKAFTEHDKVAAQAKLLALQELSLTFNLAEQYLLYVVRANIANIEGQEHKVINWLNKAVKLEPSLAKKQLDSPLFSGTYLTLATVYARQGEDKKAFDSKKKYIEKHFAYLQQQKEQGVKRLYEKYNIDKKHEENELLTQNSEIKRYALSHAKSQKIQQYRYITIFITAGIVLFLLLFRQFKVRRALKLRERTDSLTLLANRRAFFNNGYTYMAQALEADKEFSVLMLDIDNFKNINDNFGRAVGDKVICHVAALASETMRSRDFLARIGGDDFAAILPGANIEQARAIAERIREKIQHDSSKNQTDNVPITVSIGLASIDDVKESFDSLIHAADIARYQAKANGRNQVCSYLKEI